MGIKLGVQLSEGAGRSVGKQEAAHAANTANLQLLAVWQNLTGKTDNNYGNTAVETFVSGRLMDEAKG